MAMSACKSVSSILAARFFLGFPESGVWPCGIMYFSFWVRSPLSYCTFGYMLTGFLQYKPHERAHRLGVFYSSNSIAQAISGILAVGINNVSKRYSFVSTVTDSCSSTDIWVSNRGNGFSSSKERSPLHLPFLYGGFSSPFQRTQRV